MIELNASLAGLIARGNVDKNNFIILLNNKKINKYACL
jgi:hypothetical protein